MFETPLTFETTAKIDHFHLFAIGNEKAEHAYTDVFYIFRVDDDFLEFESEIVHWTVINIEKTVDSYSYPILVNSNNVNGFFAFNFNFFITWKILNNHIG